MVDALYHALNVGVIGADKLHRIDLERMRLAAEDQTNFFCDAVGLYVPPPRLWPYRHHVPRCQGKLIPFIAGSGAAYMLELTPATCASSIARPTPSSPASRSQPTIQNGTDFAASAGWTLASTSGQTTSIASNKLTLSARAHGGKAVGLQRCHCGGWGSGEERTRSR